MLRTDVVTRVVRTARYTHTDALFSDCRRYRFLLKRRWDDGNRDVCFVMLNPSQAGAMTDDATIRRCVGFARRWNYSGLVVVNLFAWVATDPRELGRLDLEKNGVRIDKTGDPRNVAAVHGACVLSQDVVVAWGDNAARFEPRVSQVMQAIRTADRPVFAFDRVTKGGQPPHPLRLPYALGLVPWERD